MARLYHNWAGIAILCVLLTLPAHASAAPTPAALPQGPGVACGWDLCQLADMQRVSAGWWVDYRAANSRIDGPGHVYLVESWQPPDPLRAFAAAHPGHSWILGNEPNDPTGYGDLCGSPAACGAIYQAQAAAIRAGDPGAALISPGLADGSLWWAAALAPGPWDAWNLHLFSAPTPAGAAWVLQRVREFRAWQAARGDTRPLIVGEVGIAPGTLGNAPAYLRTVVAGLRACGCVRAYAWFSARSGGRWPGDMLTPGGTLTPLGGVWRTSVGAAPPVRALGNGAGVLWP